LASAAAFAVGAALPVLLAGIVSMSILSVTVSGSSLILLGVLGSVAARLGGAPMTRGAVRVMFWGAVAMAASALVGRLFGTTAG
jgi:VIT1/CCC1 family predicted Fe2+/Mn2+ transporter